MTWTRGSYRWAHVLLLLVLGGGSATGCGDPLKVDDPTAVQDEDLNTAEGAELLRHAALKTLYDAVGTGALESGVLADEFLNEPSLATVELNLPDMLGVLDRRATSAFAANLPSGVNSYLQWQMLRLTRIPVALAKLRAYAPAGAREAHIGEMLAVRGYAAMRLAESVCPGFPLHDVVDYTIVHSPPLSTEQALERALGDLDSALVYAADSARVLDFARVSRGRTLLDLGRFAEAASAVSEVPTDFVAAAEYNVEPDPAQPNPLAMDQPSWAFEDFVLGSNGVADREGGNGLDFVSAADPRVPTAALNTARDGVTVLYGIGAYPDAGAPIVMASGVEARLIEAEAALQAGDAGTWLGKLNELRQRVALADTTDPGDPAARVDLTFRERAFWLFATGHRLGDLRRLVRQYGRPAESVYPTGAYWRGGVYDTATSLPFGQNEATASPGVTGCTG